jgi:hypothetical protein
MQAIVKYIPPPEEREPLDQTIFEVFDKGEEPKTWDRASIKANTHPLHPFPKTKREDLTLPKRTDRWKLVGDCAVFGVAVLGLCAFPAYMASFFFEGSSLWLWLACFVVGVLSAVWLYTRASAVTDREYIESL